MNLRAEPYLATLLAGQNSPTDLRGHGPERIRRLHRALGAPLAPLHALSIGELAAMSWLAESWTQREAVNAVRGQGHRRSISTISSPTSPAAWRGYSAISGCPPTLGYLAAVGRSPVLTRYSKAPEYAYTPAAARGSPARLAPRQSRGDPKGHGVARAPRAIGSRRREVSTSVAQPRSSTTCASGSGARRRGARGFPISS